MSRASHTAAFAAGVTIAISIGAFAVPKDVQRFRTFDGFAQALALVETNYVDPVNEEALVRDATRGMLHNLDVHSTYLPPTRYQKVRQDTEGEFGGVGLVLAPGFVDEVVPGSPAAVAGVQEDDRIVSIDGAPTAEVGHEIKEAGAWEAKLRG